MREYTLYLLHIEPAYKHAQHYLGVTRNGRSVYERWQEHHAANGAGAKLTQAARKAGCELVIARVWHNAEFGKERKLKGRSLKPLCPICNKEHG